MSYERVPYIHSFDLDLPMEVDDEYWEHPDPDQAFKQPPNKPSLVTFFNCYLRLNQVLGIALRTIVCLLVLNEAGFTHTCASTLSINPKFS